MKFSISLNSLALRARNNCRKSLLGRLWIDRSEKDWLTVIFQPRNDVKKLLNNSVDIDAYKNDFLIVISWTVRTFRFHFIQIF